MRKQVLVAVALAVAVGVSGCGGKKEKEQAALPDWVMNPMIEGGIAATDCVASTGNMSLDKAEAIAKARAAMVKQINVRVQAMDETYDRKVRSASGTTSGGTFESVSRQVADEKLRGSRALKVNFVDINGERNLCAMVGLDPKLTAEVFDAIVEQSGAEVDPQSKEVLYEEFKAFKAQDRMDDALSGS